MMKLGAFEQLLVCCACLCLTAQTELPPECTVGGHSVLQNPHRSHTFSSSWLQQKSLQDLICDNTLTPGWYQFQIHNKPATMPTKCVEVNHCGTQAPVWLSLGEGESLPSVLDSRQLTACAAWQTFQNTSEDCCMFRIPVTVRNCGDFYVYLLQPTQGCMAYCAQEMLETKARGPSICGSDQVDQAGLCKTHRPPAPSVPVILSEVIGNIVYLKCSFESSSTNSLGYFVIWSRLSPDGRNEELKQETTFQTSAFIELDGFNIRLGDKIFCSCSSFFLETPDTQSTLVESQEFFVGIRLKPEVSTIFEDGRLYELVVESTVPVPCSDGSFSSTENCSLSLQLRTSSEDEPLLGVDLSLSSCVLELPQGTCRDEVCSRAWVHFSPVIDFVKESERRTDIFVKPVITNNFLWRGYTPDPVQIKVLDVPSAHCYYFTDPHMLTFDGRFYENYHIGTFVLYRSSFWQLEVHVRQWECGSSVHAASCVCGFVVRDGNDVISFDMCDGEMGETKPHLSVRSRDLNNTRIRITESHQGRKVTIYFSTGAFVRADVSDWGMSLTLRVPGSDRNHTEGLCGTYDGEPSNDFHSVNGVKLADLQVFISEWRIPVGSSLFDTVPSHQKYQKSQKFCSCQQGPVISSSRTRSHHTTASDSTCSNHRTIQSPSIIPFLDITADYMSSVEPLKALRRRFTKKTQHIGSRTRRRGRRFLSRAFRDGSTNHHERKELHLTRADIPSSPLQSQSLQSFSYFFPEDHEPAVQRDVPPMWPTLSGLTKRQVQTQCQQVVLNSTIAVGCKTLLKETIVQLAVAMCITDLQLKEEQLWLDATLPLLENECERRLLEEIRREEEIKDVLAILRCPNLCSGNGQCSEQGCVCFPGFGSYDCSIMSDQIPEITRLDKEGLCDVRQEGCATIQVHGEGFKDSYELKCEFVKEKFEDGEWVLDTPHFIPATFLDGTALECQLPLVDGQGAADVHMETNGPLTRWQIKVSNDGYSYSNAKILTLYDGACQICSLSMEVTCTLRKKTCHIDGVCYRLGESNPSSHCFICRPQLSKHTWSTAEKNRPPLFQPPSSSLRSFHEETLIYQLQARDPEGSPVLFSLGSGPEGASLSTDGLLTWKASTQPTNTHVIQFTVTDDCNAKTRASVEVSVLPCECLNNASCATNVAFPAGSGEYTCLCPDGFTGKRCEVDIDDCKPNPCRLGRCIDGPNFFSCICPPGMTGHTCREDIDECVSLPCFSGVSCTNTPGSFTCGSCPRGYSGDGKNCTRNKNSPSKAALSPPRPPFNSKFSVPSVCNNELCFPGVQCFESVFVSTGFVCGPCPPGFHGNGRICTPTGDDLDVNEAQFKFNSSIDQPLSSSSSSPTSSRILPVENLRPEKNNSNFRKVSIPDKRTTTTSQNKPSARVFDPTVQRGQSTGTGMIPDLSIRAHSVTCDDVPCFPGVLCEPTTTGSFKCGRCPSGYTGNGVTCKAVCRYPCSRNMECTLPNICTCKQGYTGYNCYVAVCHPECKNQGKCVSPGVCECPAGYGGPTCEEASCKPPCQHGGTCLARNLCTCSYGYVGPRCEIMVCNRHCENGGECVSPDVCRCKPGWSGPTCNSAVCDPVCLNGGTCVKSNICACPSGFYGSQCQIAVCNPPCKNGGQCMRNNVCSCTEGYTGKRCQMSVCEPTCMNKGKCVGPNTCSCASGWRGERCNIPVCLQTCRNGGECVGPNTCQCPAGWEGLQCQTPICRQRCLNGGRCVLPDHCHCRKGYGGLTCAVKASRT